MHNFRYLVIVSLLLIMGAEVHAKTRIYVYNNTLSKLDFAVRQTGTNLAPQYWEQVDDAISATKADEILSIEKSGGVRNNETYGFEIDVSDDNWSSVLKIRID